MFHYYQPTKIHCGAGQLNELGHVCRGYGKTCFLVTTPDAPLQPLYERVKKLLDAEGISVIHFDKVEPNPSVEIVEQGFAMLKEQPADFVLAVGARLTQQRRLHLRMVKSRLTGIICLTNTAHRSHITLPTVKNTCPC